MRIKVLILVVFILIFGKSFSQREDTIVHHLDPIDIVAPSANVSVISAIPVQEFQLQENQALPILQLSDVLKLMSGVTLKDYGGIGGMKTVSVRGLGSQHTGVTYDGISLTDCQTGQIDLGKFSLENLESVVMEIGSGTLLALPARHFASANLIKLQTPIPHLDSSKTIGAKVGITAGSFGLISPSLSIENLWNPKQKNKVYTTLNVNYIRAKGDYPFTLHYGGVNDSTSQEFRTNSSVQRLSTEANLFLIFHKHSTLKAKIFYNVSEQELPGAVTFYNPKNAQKLWDQNLFTQLSYNYKPSEVVHYQLNVKYNHAYQRYLDPHYLNAAGKIDNHYLQNEYYLSNSLAYKPHKIFYLSFANDLIYNDMSADIADFVFPSRFTLLNLLSAHLSIKKISFNAGLLQTWVHDQTRVGESAGNQHRLSPTLTFQYKPLRSEQLYIRASFKDIFRLPTFNDLYYRLVGNISLKPERTYQSNLGVSYFKHLPIQKLTLSITADAYYNYVRDKIVAFPGKDLFVWSMLNFGRVDIWGVDLNLQGEWKIAKQIRLEFVGNYSFQHATDRTDPTSRTFGDQIPYTPRHSGTFYIIAKTKWIDLSYSFLVNGKRYALQQNIPANELSPYLDQSIALSRVFLLNRFELEAKAELLNIANVQYEVVKNYPMQGRSVRFSLRFKY